MKYFILLFLGISNLVFSQQEKAFEHKVSKGETITQIAKNYNVTVAEIYKVNPGSENGIQENTLLIVPNNKSISYMLKRNNLDAKKYTQGWKDFYFIPMKNYFTK